jgi:hypothetical protein
MLLLLCERSTRQCIDLRHKSAKGIFVIIVVVALVPSAAGVAGVGGGVGGGRRLHHGSLVEDRHRPIKNGRLVDEGVGDARFILIER